MNNAEFNEIFKDFESINLNKNGFTITFRPGTNVSEVYLKLTDAIKKIETEERSK